MKGNRKVNRKFFFYTSQRFTQFIQKRNMREWQTEKYTNRHWIRQIGRRSLLRICDCINVFLKRRQKTKQRLKRENKNEPHNKTIFYHTCQTKIKQRWCWNSTYTLYQQGVNASTTEPRPSLTTLSPPVSFSHPFLGCLTEKHRIVFLTGSDSKQETRNLKMIPFFLPFCVGNK